MIVAQLISLLEHEDPGAEVVFRPSNSYYAEAIRTTSDEQKEIASFYGADFKAVIIYNDGQVGAVK